MTNLNKYELSSVMYNYENYKETAITGRYVQYEQVQTFLEKIKNNQIFDIKKVGSSFDDRNINLIKIGNGKTRVLFWSQMHGDESTSTRAILDLLNFFYADNDTQSIREKILDSVTLYIIPMLNPDGAEKFKRENAQLIDINRDASAQQTPEGKLLYRIKNEINPQFGFNLHDQSSGYSAGLNYKPSTISLLAPPFNEVTAINGVRMDAMKLIVSLYHQLSEEIPGHIARYDDDFEPRAFGDNFTKDGVSTILIEAGGWASDPEREYVRKIYFSALVKSLLTIADRSYLSEDENEYFIIPENKERLFDLILRNISVTKNGKTYKLDIAVKHEEIFDPETKKIYYKGIISDLGDLSTLYGYEEHILDGYTLELPQTTNENGKTIDDYLKDKIAFVKNAPENLKFTKRAMNYFDLVEPSTALQIDNLANFFLSKGNELKYAVINGFMIDISKPIHFSGNGLILH